MMMIQWRQQRMIGDDEGDDRDDKGDDRDDEGDDRDDKGDEAKAKRDNRDDGETQEMKKTTMEEGRIAPSMRDDEGREQTALMHIST